VLGGQLGNVRIYIHVVKINGLGTEAKIKLFKGTEAEVHLVQGTEAKSTWYSQPGL
jgi:hypothetical protein